jgi:hypothetical protein
MVIVRLAGGLGNQMFQYAAANRLAQQRRVILKVDLATFAKNKLRAYRLPIFGLPVPVATPDEITQLRRPSRWQRAVAKVLRKPPRQPRSYVCEKNLRFDPAILQLPGKVYLEGYWQSEQYFVDVADTIRQAFTFPPLLQGKNQQLAQQIQAGNAVSIHIRRTDYVTDPAANRVLGPCTSDYYERAIRYIEEQVATPHFFVFSDEPEWARTHLQLAQPVTYVDHNGPEQDFEDMRLMSLCKHHIIANSSFSWWGAWLADYRDKIVLAPQQWFRDPTWDATDLLPPQWIRL